MQQPFAENQKKTASRKNSLYVYTNTGRMQVLHEWRAVIVTIKFLFDFVVPENLDITLLNVCELIHPRVHF